MLCIIYNASQCFHPLMELRFLPRILRSVVVLHIMNSINMAMYSLADSFRLTHGSVSRECGAIDYSLCGLITLAPSSEFVTDNNGY